MPFASFYFLVGFGYLLLNKLFQINFSERVKQLPILKYLILFWLFNWYKLVRPTDKYSAASFTFIAIGSILLIRFSPGQRFDTGHLVQLLARMLNDPSSANGLSEC
jgi:hypothetical protein